MTNQLMPLEIIIRLERTIDGISKSKDNVKTSLYIVASNSLLNAARDAGFSPKLIQNYLSRIVHSVRTSYLEHISL
ncbi:MAG: hypothetical protein Q7S06_02265 [Nanoarchaeota archaeon]|nr:hypothetical protein [Nanoarchaeota archaeon]